MDRSRCLLSVSRRLLALVVAVAVAAAGQFAAPALVAASWGGSITVLPGGDGAGRVTSDDGGIDCTYANDRNSGDCGQTYTFPDFLTSSLVTLTYTPAASSYVCVDSAGGCVTSGAPYSVTMEFRPEFSNHITVLSSFRLKSYQVQVATDGPGSISAQGGDACAPVPPYDWCRLFKHGTEVTLTAVPDPGSNFYRFEGSPCDAPGPTCTWTVQSNLNMSAVFGKWDLWVYREGGGDACIVAGASNGCADALGGGFSVTVPNGGSVSIKASPKSGWRFNGWSGACAGQDETCTITVTSAVSTTAKFARIQAATPKPTAKPTATPRPSAGSSAGPSSVAAPSATTAVQPSPEATAPSTSPATTTPAPATTVDPTGAPPAQSAGPATDVAPQASPPVLPAAGGDAGAGTNAIALFALTTGLALLLLLAFLGRRRASRVRRTRRAGDVA